MVIDLEWTETVFASGEELNGIFPPAFAALETLDEAHDFSLSDSFDSGK